MKKTISTDQLRESVLTVFFVGFCSSGLVAFRQHLQNLARTKGILELNKVQMLVEQMGSGEGSAIGPLGPQHHLHNLLEVSYAAKSLTHTHPSLKPIEDLLFPKPFLSLSLAAILIPCYRGGGKTTDTQAVV